MTTVALFDLDGLLANFVAGSLAAHGKHIPHAEIGYDFMTQAGFEGIADPAFWAPLKNPDFWQNLDPYPDGMALFTRVAAVIPMSRIGFLSSCACPGAHDGKKAWLEKHLGVYAKHFFAGEAKELLAAAPNKLLVDDFNSNVDRFKAAGGRTVLIPRPWNRRKAETDENGHFRVDTLVVEVLNAMTWP